MKQVTSYVLRRLPNKCLKQGIDGETTGHLTGTASANAIADHEESSIEIEAERIFIRRPHLANMALC
ncbi:hypothetical protein GCM10011585_07270 [Edaphobacter dinghuensis]|uniref:Uncharacterized protein n=1 Tax=Edaphobacter dinghuensis TaxID=1560005 RepID=A0A917H5B1_9BACT|nr:hypothetical protein GCM10011585_07270 [Edaphobacter dinghuensis]